MERDPLILDACCLLNLCATGHLAEILHALPYDFFIGRRACREALWLRLPDSEEREQVDLEPVLASSLLTEASPGNGPEEALFLELARVLDDGEAEAIALATYRDCILAIDDRKARRVASDRQPHLRLYSTLELLREWQNRAGVAPDQLTEVLRRIADRASCRPRRNDPLWDWWQSLVGDL